MQVSTLRQYRSTSSPTLSIVSTSARWDKLTRSVFMKLQIPLARTEAEWPGRDRVVEQAGLNGKERPENRYLFGKTVGMLVCPPHTPRSEERPGQWQLTNGVARETARLFNAFHCNVIAANSKGHQRPEHGVGVVRLDLKRRNELVD